MPHKIESVVRSIFFIALAAFVLPAHAQVQPNMQNNPIQAPNPLLGAPTVTITESTLNRKFGTVTIKWTVDRPTLTVINKFEISFHARFILNGKAIDRDAKNLNLSGNVRETILEITPTDGTLQSAKTVLNTKFQTQTTLTATETVNLNSTGNANARPGNAVTITSVRKLEQCATGQDCFEVKWSTNSNLPSIVGFNSFTIKLDVNYQDGRTQSGNANAGSNQRQVSISVNKPIRTTAVSATATVSAIATIANITTTTKETVN